MIGTCWLVKKLSDNRNWKITRVSPAQSETNGAFHIREPGQANEMVSIEEVATCLPFLCIPQRTSVIQHCVREPVCKVESLKSLSRRKA